MNFDTPPDESRRILSSASTLTSTESPNSEDGSLDKIEGVLLQFI
jgi:hypothetical protein